jgi:hypothetical protein
MNMGRPILVSLMSVLFVILVFRLEEKGEFPTYDPTSFDKELDKLKEI